ncbi:MAG: NAD-dependent epimerase/dehydratase family protein, partial [Clostridiales bacterium]|nr:NAD-dependent epimerase/dehydratase family protein [Clostridiales bacterium]
MNILVTGGAGYIGTHTLVELLNRGHGAVVVDDFKNSHPEGLRRVREITGKTFPFYEVDVCDEEALSTVFSENAIDCAIHFAGLKAVGESCERPLAYYRNNLDGMMSLLSAMERHGVRKLVFSSSATVYRSDVEMPVHEDSPLGSINPYGWTKFMCEQMLRDMAAAHPDWSV